MAQAPPCRMSRMEGQARAACGEPVVNSVIELGKEDGYGSD